MNTTAEEIRSEIKAFLNSKQRNSWLHFTVMNVYVRKGIHRVFGETRATFDIANITVREEVQNNGYFTLFTSIVEEFDFPVYVENVYDEWLVQSLCKRGFTIASTDAANTTCLFRNAPDAWWLPNLDRNIVL